MSSKKYKVSFTITPSKKKITLGFNNFDKVLKDKIKLLELCYGKITKLEIKREAKWKPQ